MIPKNLIRTVPKVTAPKVETWWKWTTEIHQDWEHITYRDPIDRDLFPISSPYWDQCTHGAQMAGLIRLEAVWNLGGVYVDSDFQAYRSFAPLLGLSMFAGYEDQWVVPDAVFGAEAKHPALLECLSIAIELIELGRGPWDTGPGVFTDVLVRRQDVTLFPPSVFYPFHYSVKNKPIAKKYHGNDPWCIGAHHWNASWVGKG
jgi:mannosyltransferase OCH1-like enzyme